MKLNVQQQKMKILPRIPRKEEDGKEREVPTSVTGNGKDLMYIYSWCFLKTDKHLHWADTAHTYTQTHTHTRERAHTAHTYTQTSCWPVKHLDECWSPLNPMVWCDVRSFKISQSCLILILILCLTHRPSLSHLSRYVSTTSLPHWIGFLWF